MSEIQVFVIFILFVWRFVNSGVRFLPEAYYFLTTQGLKKVQKTHKQNKKQNQKQKQKQ